MTEKPKFELGETVLLAGVNPHVSERVECQSCEGVGVVTVRLERSGEEHRVVCRGCDGRKTEHRYTTKRVLGTGVVSGVAVDPFYDPNSDDESRRNREPFEYTFRSCPAGWSRIFKLEEREAAEQYVEELFAKLEPEMNAERITGVRRHDLESVSWTTHYHRKKIQDAKKSIEWHESRLRGE